MFPEILNVKMRCNTSYINYGESSSIMKNSVYMEINEMRARYSLLATCNTNPRFPRNRLRTNVKHISVEGNEENESSEVRSKCPMYKSVNLQ